MALHPSNKKHLDALIAAMALPISLSDEQLEQYLEYLALMAKWNRAYNLTAITTFDDMLRKHLLDSLTVVPFIEASRYLDVGAGAGLPGVVLAITFPEKHFTLLDSNGKKCRFLREVKRVLGLKNMQVVHERVEHFKPEHCFEGIISRAFSALDSMLEMTSQICCNGGRFLAMKGKYPARELQSLPLEFELVQAHPLIVPGIDAERHLLILKKRNAHSD